MTPEMKIDTLVEIRVRRELSQFCFSFCCFVFFTKKYKFYLTNVLSFVQKIFRLHTFLTAKSFKSDSFTKAESTLCL
ncbi:hypothetical protein NIES4073_06700 [Kalymmatonema gypsitolerans NIES-4073]|nr:hypothetical protein NIES4073_06700 [Scytonema sp. NIES-4073]